MAQPDPLEVHFQLRRGDANRVGMDRIRLLKAIAERGSISKAGQTVGISFRAAWNSVQALNNLFDRPLVVTQVGGATGGSATVTALGAAVIAGYEKLDRNLNALMAELNESLSGEAGLSPSQVLWSLGMKTSARNALRGVVETVTDGAVNGEVILRISPAVTLCAVITRSSIEDLGLEPGREAVALIKSSFVILAPAEESLRTSARNQLQGVVISHQTGAVNDEIVLELDPGKTLTATITRGSAEDLGFKVGDKVQALIKASHVILAVD
ncbi:TOBE domain-containing protein [Phenylobacterium sp.]|uniref:TOBE domain-containing protein n=1 Tax=Phenylobacterium sp. TaxID=1871053 RepID=UPI0011F590FA|nr:TOBE domain-containing protein [Phenylobacterium sp.]THD58121.1 MAG: LysR family transcriptional regulator [Phenylobacterium sp.]